MAEKQTKYYGTVTELQEIRKALKYLATSYDNLSQLLAKQNPQAIAEQLTLRFEGTVESVIKKYITDDETPSAPVSSKQELYDELRRLQKEFRWARTLEEQDRLRGLINSIMYDINNY